MWRRLAELPTRVTTLRNGLRVASEMSNYGQTACVGVWIDSGSRNESTKNNGTAHFLEHMAFKGTTKRTQTQLEVEIEDMGAHLNAYTSREQTVYYARVFKHDVEKGIEILSDILQNSTLDDRAIARERDVILREMQEVNKVEEEAVLDHLHEVVYKESSLGKTILGPEENVRSLSKEDLLDYIATYYSTERMVIVGAGAVDHDHLCELAEKYFSNLPRRDDVMHKEMKYEPAIFQSGELIVPRETREPGETFLAVAFESGSWTSEFSFPMMLIQNLCGSWERAGSVGMTTHGSLARDIGSQGLAHGYATFNTLYKDTGIFGVYARGESSKAPDLVQCIVRSLMKYCVDIDVDEMERVKTQLKMNLLLHLDNFANIAEDIGRQILTYGRRMTVAELFERIDAIDKDDIIATANRFFNDEECALITLGDTANVPKLGDVKEIAYLPL